MNFYDRVQGIYYTEVLRRLNDVLSPTNYVEIGSRTGGSLEIFGCNSVAIDPTFSISTNVIGKKPTCHFFQMTSDKFFEKYSLNALFGGPVDFAFLDGMHLAEFLLRDFMNIERQAKANSIIAIHDCLPGEYNISARQEGSESQRSATHPEWWTGDVWKIIPILQKYRPDLHIIPVDAAPTGLILITNLDPENTTLKTHYSEITRNIVSKYKEEEFIEFWRNISIVSANKLVSMEDIYEYFWL